MDINVANLSGRLGKKPELKTAGNGTDYTQFSIASSVWNGKEQATEWIDIVAFGSTAKFVTTYLDAGDQVFVSGTIRVNTYEKDGVKRKNVTINASSVVGGAKKGKGTVAAAEPVMEEVTSDEPLPF